MNKLLFIIAFLFSTAFTFAQDVYVQGYTRSNGTYVQGYYRSAPNTTRNDNYSTLGNTNPYTGIEGTQSRDSGTAYRSVTTISSYSVPTSNYSSSSNSSSRTIYTGPRGGQYYINSNGNKTYVRR